MHRFLLAVLLFVTVQNVLPQSIALKHYNTRNTALVQNQVIMINQAGDGALWLSTYGGLSRFNGKKFTNYTISEGLQTNIVFGTVDADDTLWISTRDGIDILVNNRLTNYFKSPSMGMYYGQFYKYKDLFYLINVNSPTNEKLKNVFQIFDVRANNFFSKVFCEDSIPILGEIIPWQDSALSLGPNALYNISLRDLSARRRTCAERDSGTIPAQLHNGFVAFRQLKTYNVSAFDALYYVNPSHGFPLTKVLGANDTTLTKTLSYSICNGESKFRFLDMDLKLYKIMDGKPKILADISSIHHDNLVRDNYWYLGTDNGFYKLEMAGFEYFRASDGFPKDVWTALPDAAGRIWFAGFNSKDVFVYDGNSVQPIETKLLKVYYNSAVMGYQNDIFFPSHIGVSVFKQNGRLYREIKLDKSTLGLAADNSHKLVLTGTMDKIYSIDTLYQTKLLFETSEIGPYQTIISILPHKDLYYLGMSKGFGVYDPSTDKGKLLINKTMRVSDLTADTTGMIWLATDQGLFTWQADSLQPVLPSLIRENLLTIERSDDNRLFIAGVTALFTIDLNKYHQKLPHYLLTYRESAGYEPLEPGQNSFHKDDKGCLWLPTVEHVVKIDPAELILPKHYPVANMVSAMAVNESYSDTLFFSEESSITVDYEFNNLSFVFEAVELDFPESLRFEYMLEGRHDNWLRLDDENNLHFDNLEPGKYTLMVRASRSETFEEVPVAKVQLTVLPPYWMKWWFVALLILVAAGLVAGFVILLMQRKQRHERGQLELNRLRSAALSVQIDHHFLANNISKITLMNQKGLYDRASEFGLYFTRFLQRNVRFLRADFVSLEEELELIRSYVAMENVTSKNIQLDITKEDGLDPAKMMVLPFLLQPLIENAVKYGLRSTDQHTTSVLVNIQCHDELLSISVVNEVEQDSMRGNEGHHLALTIIRDRLKIIGGRSEIVVNKMVGRFQALILIDLKKITNKKKDENLQHYHCGR